MARVDELYHRLSLGILEQGYWYEDKSREVRCKQLTSLTIDFDIEHDFPLLTTKQMYFKGIVGELLWFLRGEDNILPLVKENINIWNRDAFNWYKRRFPVSKTTLEDFPQEVLDYEGNYNNVGDVGRNYGVQWRRWTTTNEHMLYVDQIRGLINNLKSNPMSRRHIVTAWNPAELHQTALPPCHWAFEILPRPMFEFEKELNPGFEYCFTLKWHQRSVDTFLGLPFNIASYALLSKIIEALTGYKALGLIGDLSNVHLYEDHIETVREQLKNNPSKYKAPTFRFSEDAKKLFFLFKQGTLDLDSLLKELTIEDFIIDNYQSYPTLKADMIEPKNNS